jgi:hypothetical protein
LAKRCDLLPINALAEGHKVKKPIRMTRIGLVKMKEKRLRPSGDRSVELHLSFCFQQRSYPRVGRWLKDAGRRLQSIGDIW